MDPSHLELLRSALAEWRSRLREPWLVAAWPGMGAVARLAASYAIRQCGAQRIGDLSLEPAADDMPAIEVERGLILPPRLSTNTLYGWHNEGSGHDLVFFESDAQPRQGAYRAGQELIEAALALGVVRVCTFAAMATLIEPDAKPRVFAAASSRSLLDEALRHGAVPLLDGSIGGLNGVLVEIAARRRIEGLCLLGEMPYYASAIGNPKASAAVLRLFAGLAGIEIDLDELDAQGAVVESQLVDFQKRFEREVRKASPPGERDLEVVAPSPSQGRSSERQTRERIEELFAEARSDRGKAMLLKAELDRHGLFAEYEDRFLDLFKRAE